MRFKLNILDWSGVCSDDRMPVYEANMGLLKHFGKPSMSFEEWLPRTRLSVSEFLYDNGVEGSHEDLSALYKSFFNEINSKGIIPEPYDDVYTGLGMLARRGGVVILSSHPEDNLHKEAKRYGVDKFITFILGSVKDKSDGLVKILTTFGLTTTDAIYTGDTIYDIEAAKNVGVVSAAMAGPIGRQRGYHDRERLLSANPDFLLEGLLDFENLGSKRVLQRV